MSSSYKLKTTGITNFQLKTLRH